MAVTQQLGKVALDDVELLGVASQHADLLHRIRLDQAPAQQALLRGLVAKFWDRPYERTLTRWKRDTEFRNALDIRIQEMEKSSDPFAAPAIRPNYLADEFDPRVLVDGMNFLTKEVFKFWR